MFPKGFPLEAAVMWAAVLPSTESQTYPQFTWSVVHPYQLWFQLGEQKIFATAKVNIGSESFGAARGKCVPMERSTIPPLSKTMTRRQTTCTCQ